MVSGGSIRGRLLVDWAYYEARRGTLNEYKSGVSDELYAVPAVSVSGSGSPVPIPAEVLLADLMPVQTCITNQRYYWSMDR